MTVLTFLQTCGSYHPERDHLIVWRSLDDYLAESCHWVELVADDIDGYTLSCHLDLFQIEPHVHSYDFSLILSNSRCFKTICESVMEAVRHEA